MIFCQRIEGNVDNFKTILFGEVNEVTEGNERKGVVMVGEYSYYQQVPAADVIIMLDPPYSMNPEEFEGKDYCRWRTDLEQK